LLQEALDADYQHILFLHAISGCDTTSALYLQGKKKALKILSRKVDLSETLQKFNSSHADPEEIAVAGEKFLIELYGGTTSTSFDELRFKVMVNLGDTSSPLTQGLPASFRS
jgi:hypothetical protein